MPHSTATTATHNNLVIFDLDGVITSEDAYWDTAGLVIHELLYSPHYWHVDPSLALYLPPQTASESRRISREILPETLILDLKARSVNSNWDTCYAGFSLHLIDLLSQLPARAALLPLRPWDAAWIAAFRLQLAQLPLPAQPAAALSRPFDTPIFQGYSGLALLERLNAYASERLSLPIEDVFARYSPSWHFCENLFQEWYLGETFYTREYGHPPSQLQKPGCIHFEQPLLPLDLLRSTLENLCSRGYTLGVATGRPGAEAIAPLKQYGLFSYFSEDHIVTHAQVAEAESLLRDQGQATSLVKPHPYQFLRAADPAYQPGQPALPRGSFIVVGDTPSDVRGGHSAGALVLAVLSGARTPASRTLLEQSQPDFLLTDMTEVPAILERIDDLATIQRLQFTERATAELLLQRWFARFMSLSTDQVTLTPKAVSLNSFNGIYRADGNDYFFKTHVEEQGVLEEYYNATMLYESGYNIVRPLRSLHEKGQQMVIYPVIHSPVMFDLMRAVETGHTEQANLAILVAAELRECQRLLTIYERTLAPSTAQEYAHAPIHQLFWHRLTGERYKRFYEGKQIPLPAPALDQPAASLSFSDLLDCTWTINGRDLAINGESYTLGRLLSRAQVLLDPSQPLWTVIGHGDAHFGNVFLEDQREYCYFDPAFAGRHSPLLDIVKPLFHNIFATWMYFPHEIAQDLHLSLVLGDHHISLEHDYRLTPVRQAILDAKLHHLLPPLLELLRTADALPAYWDDLIRSALLCCPLLTVNLLDSARMPAAITWLGLSFALEMGHLSLIGG